MVELWAGLSFDAIGLLLGLGAACCQVGYFLPSDHGGDEAEPVDPLGVVAYGLLIGTLVLTVIARPWGMDWSVLGGRADLDGTRLPAALLLVWVVLVSTVVAYLTGVLAVQHLSPPVAGVVACLEAVVATVLAWVLLGERLSAPQVLDGLVVLSGAFIAQTSAPAVADGAEGAEGTTAPTGRLANGDGGRACAGTVSEGDTELSEGSPTA